MESPCKIHIRGLIRRLHGAVDLLCVAEELAAADRADAITQAGVDRLVRGVSKTEGCVLGRSIREVLDRAPNPSADWGTGRARAGAVGLCRAGKVVLAALR